MINDVFQKIEPFMR